MARKNARLLASDLMNSGIKKKVFGTFYPTTIRSGKKRTKSVEACRKN